jgi:hypothetical protein
VLPLKGGGQQDQQIHEQGQQQQQLLRGVPKLGGAPGDNEDGGFTDPYGFQLFQQAFLTPWDGYRTFNNNVWGTLISQWKIFQSFQQQQIVWIVYCMFKWVNRQTWTVDHIRHCHQYYNTTISPILCGSYRVPFAVPSTVTLQKPSYLSNLTCNLCDICGELLSKFQVQYNSLSFALTAKFLSRNRSSHLSVSPIPHSRRAFHTLPFPPAATQLEKYHLRYFIYQKRVHPEK